jgi:hypothetical protein
MFGIERKMNLYCTCKRQTINKQKTKIMSTQNLLVIETAFLSNPIVKNGLQFTKYNAIQRHLENGAKKRFAHSLELAKVLNAANTWWESEGKEQAKIDGIVWTKDEFTIKAYGLQKSFYSKLVKAAKLETETVNNFVQYVEDKNSEGVKVSLSIEKLLQFAKDGKTSEAQSEGEGEGEGEGEEAEKTVLTLSFKPSEGGNIAVRVDNKGRVKTSNSIAEIESAIAFLKGCLPA